MPGDSKEYLKEIQDFEYHDFVKSIKRESRTYIETFFNFLDASDWITHHLDDHDPNIWHLEQCSINLINGAYRAGVVFSLSQKELDFG